MRVFNKTFTNELGGEVDLRLDWTGTVDGVDAPGRVTIYMAGPDSVSENIVTIREARELRDALNKVIR